jgi:hypothetical protein
MQLGCPLYPPDDNIFVGVNACVYIKQKEYRPIYIYIYIYIYIVVVLALVSLQIVLYYL